MVNLFKILGYNLTYAGPNLITATPYEINSSISQFEEAILEATVDKSTLPGPVTVSVSFILPNGNEYENVYMLSDVDQPNKYRLRLNDVIGNELSVGETNTITVAFKVRTETDVFITTANILFDLYKTNLDISYHPTDIDSLFIGLNKLSMNIADVDSTVQNYVDIATSYTDEKVGNLKDTIDSQVSALIYTKAEANKKFQTKAEHIADIETLVSQSEARYETKTDAANKFSDAKKYAEELILNIGGGESGSVDGDLVLNQAKIYTDQQISNIIDSAPEKFNTFKEIADYISKDETQAKDIIAQINNKANANDVYTKTQSDNKYVVKETGKGLSSNDYTSAERTKLSSLKNYDDTAVKGRLSALEAIDYVQHAEVYTKTESDNRYAKPESVTAVDSKFNNYYTKTEVTTALNSKQERLVSGTNIKTINGVSILGSGNIVVQGGSGSTDLTGYATEDYVNRKIEEISELDPETLETIKQLSKDLGENQEAVDTLNNAIALKADKDSVYTKSEVNTIVSSKADSSNTYTKVETAELLAAKQNVLVSGQTIKTVNGESILGEGNIDSVNETRVNQLIDAAVGNIDLSTFYTKAESDDKFFEKKDISEYAKVSYVNDAITNLVGSAPETLDTLQEISTAIQSNQSAIDAINTIAAGKANKEDVYTKAEVDNAIENVDVSAELANYYTKTEIDNSKFATQSWVTNKNYATISEIPTKVSELDNDLDFINVVKTINGQSIIGSGNITINVDVSSLETKSDAAAKLSEAKVYTDTAINNIIGGAPSAFDTLKEISDYISSDKTGSASMLASINTNKTNINNLQTKLALEESTRISEVDNLQTQVNELSNTTSKRFNNVDTKLENYYTRTEANDKFLEYSETISKSEAIVDFNSGKTLKFSTDSADTEFVISDISTPDLSTLLSMMIPNEY